MNGALLVDFIPLVLTGRQGRQGHEERGGRRHSEVAPLDPTRLAAHHEDDVLLSHGLLLGHVPVSGLVGAERLLRVAVTGQAGLAL